MRSPAVVDGIVYVGSEDGNLYALKADSGAVFWSFKTGGVVMGSPTVVNGIVYFGSADAKVYALNANTGAQEWTFATGKAVLVLRLWPAASCTSAPATTTCMP